MKKVALGVVVLVLGAAAVVMLVAPSAYEVVDKGHGLLPYDSGVVYKVKVADSITLYVDEETQPDPDKISGPILLALCASLFLTLYILSLTAQPRHLRRFYLFAGLGLAFLGLDETLGVHETLGHNLRFLGDLPGIDHPDDAIVALYLIPIAAFVLYFRDVLFATTLTLRLFVGGAICFVLSVAADVAGTPLDEPLELLAAFALAAGLVAMMAAHLRAAVAPQPVRTS